MTNQQIDTEKKYESIQTEGINSDLLESLNCADISNQEYRSIFDKLYKKVINGYEQCSDNNLKEKYFDLISEMIIACKYQTEINDKIYEKFQKNICRDKYYETLLKYYKQYDYLNKNTNLVKILVGYIKPSFLFKTDILTPIHLGRAIESEGTKDGIASENDINWLHKNCIGDNDFKDNISKLNHRIGFFTGAFSIWKNHNEMGGPEYIGSFGHRRLLFPNCLSEIEKYDLILPIKKSLALNLKDDFIANNNNIYYDIIINTISELYPDELDDFNEYFNGNEGYFAEIYIMKKELFFDYCEWIYKIIKLLTAKYENSLARNQITNIHMKELLSKYLKIEQENYNFSEENKEVRDLAYMIEVFTGYYLYKLTKTYKYKEAAVFEPHYFTLLLQDKSLLNILRRDLKTSFGRKNG